MLLLHVNSVPTTVTVGMFDAEPVSTLQSVANGYNLG
jgi:hypothetical protein